MAEANPKTFASAQLILFFVRLLPHSMTPGSLIPLCRMTPRTSRSGSRRRALAITTQWRHSCASSQATSRSPSRTFARRSEYAAAGSVTDLSVTLGPSVEQPAHKARPALHLHSSCQSVAARGACGERTPTGAPLDLTFPLGALVGSSERLLVLVRPAAQVQAQCVVTTAS